MILQEVIDCLDRELNGEFTVYFVNGDIVDSDVVWDLYKDAGEWKVGGQKDGYLIKGCYLDSEEAREELRKTWRLTSEKK